MNRKPTPQLNRKELELISAYLDGQLPEAQRRQLRQRMAQDAAFKQAFEDLRLTRLALRSAPKIKRRRSFTLSPEMVGQRTRVFGLQAASRLVAVVATVMLAVVFAGDVFLLRGGSQSLSFMTGMEAANDMVMENAADLEIMSADEPMGGGGEMPMVAGEAVEGEGIAEDAVEGEAAAAPLAPEEDANDTAAVEAGDEAVDEGRDDDAADGEQSFAGASPQPTQTPAPEGTKIPETARVVPTKAIQESEEAPEEETAPKEPTDDEIIAQAPPDGRGQGPEEPQETQLPWILIIELGLLAVALGSGAVALLARRRT
jgi:hypothetical protein